MALAGELAVAPGNGETQNTTDTGTFTAETVTDTVTATLISGKEYEVEWCGQLNSSVNNDIAQLKIREDTVAGNQLKYADEILPNATWWFGFVLKCRYTAVANGSKTFVFTVVRAAGTGNFKRRGNANSPSLFTVKQVL